MNYESFLFTRNQQRDFTAFIRPKGLSNKAISTLSSAFSYVQDITPLSPHWSALYCFPIEDHILLLRHYDSGRKHAGRNIPTLEGIAVKRTQARHFSLALPHILAQEQAYLGVSSTLSDINTLEISESAQQVFSPQASAPFNEVDKQLSAELVESFVTRLREDRLFLPFSQDGKVLLRMTLADSRFPALYFAFGTNADVLSRLHKAEIDVDIVSYFTTQRPSLRNRETNAITYEISDYVNVLPLRPHIPLPIVEAKAQAEPTFPSDASESAIQAEPIGLNLRHPVSKPATPTQNTLEKFNEGQDASLTPRQLARLQREQQKNEQEADDITPKRHWLSQLIARLLGRT